METSGNRANAGVVSKSWWISFFNNTGGVTSGVGVGESIGVTSDVGVVGLGLGAGVGVTVGCGVELDVTVA